MIIDNSLPSTYDLDQATQLQDTLSQRLVLAWDNRAVGTIAGIDVGYTSDSVKAAISVFRYPELTHIQTVKGEAPQDFPYIPSLLAYRVGPAILSAWELLDPKPDLLLIHGHGIAHPRRMGLASHLGLWLNIPTIGVAKTLLYGCPAEPDSQVGDWSKLTDEHASRRTIGAILRTRLNCSPVYVSAGHLIDLRHSIMFVLETCRGYRMPEPIRAAHRAAANTLPH